MIARRLSFPRMRSPDCGYSSTKSSESSRSWASMSFAAIARRNCSTVVRLSATLSSSPLARHTLFAVPVGSVRPVRSGTCRLRADVLVQPEDVIGIVRPLESTEPVVLLVPVDPPHDVIPLFDDVVHVLAGPREWLESRHRGAAPGDVVEVPLLVDPEGLGAEPMCGSAASESHRIFRHIDGGAAL